MMANSSIYNNSVANQQVFISNSFMSTYSFCLTSRPASIIFTMYIIVHFSFHLPLSLLIVHHLFRKSKNCSIVSAGMSHSDCFSYNMATMQFFALAGFSLAFCGLYKENQTELILFGIYASAFTWYGEIFFHILTSLEHYLAVVHPITYLCLKNDRALRFRNIITGCVWLICFVGLGLMTIDVFKIINFCLLLVSLIIVSFCSVSVLCVLIQSGPRNQEGVRERVHQSKQRAFYTIVIILAVLLLRFVWGLFWAILDEVLKGTDCVTMTVDVWASLPSSLALPFLFLYRSGKCVCCKRSSQ